MQCSDPFACHAERSEEALVSPRDEKVDEIVLALLSLTLHDGDHAWKGFDWGTLNRLYEQGWIENPRNKTKSMQFTEEGLDRSRRLFKQYFGKPHQS